MSEDVTRKKEINGHHVYVTKLFGDGEEGQFHTLVTSKNIEKPYGHTGDRTSSEKFIVEKVNQ